MHKIAVKLDGLERWKKSAAWLHLAAGCFLLVKMVDYFQTTNYQSTGWLIPLFMVALASLLYAFLKKRMDPTARYNGWIRLLQIFAFSALAFAYTLQESALVAFLLFAWALVCVFLWFTEKKTAGDRRLTINEAGILIPGAISDRTILWNQIKEVVARPDYFTIFQTNDTYLQLEVDEQLAVTELESINDYCKRRIQQIAGTQLSQKEI